ncbi:MAG TPA: OpgC domain-containing protein [Polyangiaceae bacterium]|nr:OpgC domain-containing protein [Polyangiaceae bacterium]
MDQFLEEHCPSRTSVAGALRSWRYVPTSRRDLRLDLLRGICIAIVLVDHVGGWSPLYYLTGGARFFVTAAEGFVCISGVVFGGVYWPIAEKAGMRSVWRKALKRAAMLYVVAIVSSLVLLAGAVVTHLPVALFHDAGEVGNAVLKILLFRRIFRFVMILTLYSLLTAAAPLGIWLLHRRLPAVLAAGSLCLYTAFQLFPDGLDGPLPQNYLFHPAAYQALFFLSMIVGYHGDELRIRFTPQRRRGVLLASGIALAALLALHRTDGGIIAFALPTSPEVWMENVFGREFLRPGRLVAAGVVFTFLFLVVDYAWKPIERAAGWFFLRLGKRSLYCYVVHIPTAAIANHIAARWIHGSHSGIGNFIAQLVVLAVVWALVRFEFLTWLLP